MPPQLDSAYRQCKSRWEDKSNRTAKFKHKTLDSMFENEVLPTMRAMASSFGYSEVPW